MAKKSVVLRGLLVLCFLIGLPVRSIHAMPTEDEQAFAQSFQERFRESVWQTDDDIPDSYDLMGENETFRLYGNPTSLAFKVVDKRSGYIWHSNLDEKAEEDRLNRTWTAFATSGISIDYLDKKAISERASITNAEHTVDFQRIDQGFQATINFTEPSITLTLTVVLEDAGVRVEVPFESIQENDSDFKLGLLYVYPFFGATRDDAVDGYMFIPDGSGSLIRFSAETKAKNMFYGRYYGTDLGMISVLPWDPTINRAYRLSIPVLGMVHGEKQNAYIAIVEKGASYGELHAHPSGVTTNFNFLYNAFIYNESYFQATNRAGAGVTTLQQQTNQFDVLIHYRFLTKDDSDYVGMARSYQQYLIENEGLKQNDIPSGDIGIRLEFLGGEKERILLWNRLIQMTTISQMSEIVNSLAVKNPQVIYYGWQPDGASSMPPTTLKIDGGLGSLDELRAFVERVNQQGGRVYLYLDPQAALMDEEGYSPRYDLAFSITNTTMIGYNRQKVNYFFNTAAVSERFSSLNNDLFKKVDAGLALDSIGSMAYSDFKKNNFLSRENTIEQYRSLLGGSKVGTAFYMPNDYAFAFMQAYYDIPIDNSGYIYTTEEVPFLQIVLAGHVPYFGKAFNFSSNSRDDLLRHADYGVYPSFFLSQDVTAKIMNTSSNWIYTSSYQQWKEEIERTYQWLNNLLGPVTGQPIIAREPLGAGVVATTYGNGKQIIVNYSDVPFSAGSLTIGPKDAVITEGLP